MSHGVVDQVARAEPEGCDRREQILRTATRLFAEQGYADCVTQTGPGWWCRVGARLSNWMLRPIPDFRYRYEARQEPR